MMALIAVTFVACNIDDIEEISITPGEISVRVGEFEYKDYTVTVTYDSGKQEEIELSADMIAASDRLKFFIEGDYEIPVSYKDKTATLKVNVRRNVFEGATFEDLDVVYNGEFYTVEVKNVPEGTTVTYPTTNRFRSAGEYEATAILRKDAYEMKEMKAKVTIRKADYDLSNVVFEDKTEVFDGNQHILALEGTVPSGLYIDYTITREGGKEEIGNSARNAGSYTVQVSFVGDSANYNLIEPMEAVLTITQAEMDLSGISFEDSTEIYDRTRHELSIQGTLPQGVSVTYENNGQISAGTYKVTAKFAVDDTVNYAPIESKTAILTIEKADYDMSAVHFNGTRATYDGTEKEIVLQGELPIGVSVTYTGNTGVNAGTYRATATFSVSDKNYNAPRPLTAELIIDPVAAEMDKVVFERRRFISRDRSVLDNFELDLQEYLEELEALEEEGEDYREYFDEEYIMLMTMVQYYNPYTAANRYRPTNLPLGMTVSSVEYYKTAGVVEDLTSFGVNGADSISEINEPGYYVVVVGFDGHGNYSSITPAKTQIRVDTVDSFPDFNLAIYGENWLDRTTNRTESIYFDYTHGSCTYDDTIKQVGTVIFDYCDCNVFLDYEEGGANAIVSPDDANMPDSTRNAFADFAEKLKTFIPYYKSFIEYNGTLPIVGPQLYRNLFDDLVSAAKAASVGPYYSSEPVEMDANEVVFVGLDYGGATSRSAVLDASEYRELVAKLFGYTDASAFLEDAAGVRDTMLANSARATMNSVADQCAYRGAIYENVDGSNMFILPYKFAWWPNTDDGVEQRSFFVYVVIDNSEGSNRTSVFISNASMAMDCVNDTQNHDIDVYGRCMTTESPGYRWYPRTRTVTVDGQEVTQYVTSGNESFTFVGIEGTENLTEVRSVFKFRTELPGNCTETIDGYDEAEYTISTDDSIVTFCEDDLLSKMLRDGGNASAIAKREAREDHAQYADETVAMFDNLSAYFEAFFKHRTDDDYWRIDTTNRYYGAYRDFFESARSAYASANRNLGKDNEYEVADSVIVGLNEEFAIWIAGNNTGYSVNDYRETVMRLFGYDDIDTFTTYADTLAKTLRANEKRASAEYVSTRLLYDGAFYTSNGYFVLPYAFESKLTEKRVLSFIFVDNDGNMAIWLSDARNANAAVNFPIGGGLTTINVVGRCLLFEEDFITMLDNLDSEFLDTIYSLEGYNPFVGNYESQTEEYIAIEKFGNISGVGKFVVYTELVDSEGFSVNLSSVYHYQLEPELLKGFYTLVTVASLDDVRASNLRQKEAAETPYEPVVIGDDDESSEG